MTRARRWQILVTTRFGAVRQLYVIPGRGYSYRRGKTGRVFMTTAQAQQAKKWAARRLARNVRALPRDRRWPFLELAPGAVWPTDRALLRRLNAVARKRRRIVRLISGKRSLAQQRRLWEAWQAYKNGTGPYANLAAYPNGNAPHIRGVAADCGVISATGTYVSLGLDRRARRLAEAAGLRAWVPGEPWHWQRAETY